MKRTNKKSHHRNPVQVAMMERYGHTQTTHRDRRERRPKDARNDARREEW
jgi:hypothetical protein